MYEAKNKEFSRILLPIDGSDSSMKAAAYAIAMTRKKGDNNNAELITLYVIHSEIKHVYSTYSFGGSVNQNSIDEIIEDAKKEAQTWFDKVQEEAKENNVKLRREIIVNSRSIVGAVVDYAEHEGVDLIVIGSRGLSGFRKLLLGSVASGIVTYAHCPVLVVK
jgi:nucleotide-binding universal stress UspA family protein